MDKSIILEIILIVIVSATGNLIYFDFISGVEKICLKYTPEECENWKWAFSVIPINIVLTILAYLQYKGKLIQ